MGDVHGELVWDWLYVRSMWVALGFRGVGIGAGLLAAIEATALGEGFCRAHLETTSSKALGICLKHGYETFGHLPDEPVGHLGDFLKREL